MSLEYKVDELSRNILLLSAKTEQRHQQSEQNLAGSQAALKQAEEVLKNASQDIHQVTKETVQKNLASSIDEFEQQINRVSSNFKHSTDNAQKEYSNTLKTLKTLIWCGIGAFMLAAVVCVVSIMFIFQSSKQQIRRAEWVADINQAVANGSLNQCSAVHRTVKSGLCVKMKDKWTPIQ